MFLDKIQKLSLVRQEKNFKNFLTIQSWRIQNGDFGKSLVGGNRYLLSSVPSPEFDERKVASPEIKIGRLLLLAKFWQKYGYK